MADIKSLAVRGVRSFGPDENDEQRISFEKPLTLILGQNGCGKTTIIECLRYAITGQMPPGSRNECFVHDAKVNRSTEVLGQVKVKLTNAKNKQLEVSRSMKVTALAKKKTVFKTLDSFLSVVDENGGVKDISSRCTDLDRVMLEELGVPKAILNSVIFCHQEDSSWPLDEGKKVKERFDEIFDADKYSDCFERLRKLRKEYVQNLKLLELEVTHLTERKQDVDKKKLEAVNTETKISESELKVAELSTELKPITEKLTAIETLQKNLVQWETKREKIKAKLEHNKTQEEELKKTIKTIFEGPIEELQSAIKNHDATAKANNKELTESYKKINSFNKDEEKIANETENNKAKHNKLVFLESQNQERIDKRNKCIVETAKMAGLETPETIESNEDAEKGIADLTEKVKSLKNELKELKASADAEEKTYQQSVDESRDAVSRHKQKISSKEMEIATARKDILKLEKQITDATESKSRLEVLEQRLQSAEEEYQTADAELNQEEAQKEINDDEKELEAFDKERDELADKITKLQKMSTKLKERDLAEDNMKQKEKQFSVMQNKHRTALTEILGEMPESGYAMQVNKFEVKMKGEVDGIKKKLKTSDREVNKFEVKMKGEVDGIKKKLKTSDREVGHLSYYILGL
ncbi:AAA domain-containing protein [Phthorimaea operculella]|nr:AAA domain-containing protein [Phthorimaea operculella]